MPNIEARALYSDFQVIKQASETLPKESWQKHKALGIATAIMNAFDENDVDSSVAKGKKIADSLLGEKRASPEVYNSATFRNPEGSLVYGIGHCHIDTAWLWPIGETRRKIARSWASMLDNMEKYPEFVFACSQVVQYHWLKENYPSLFERLRARVKEGRFVPVGGAWIEADGYIPSGEAYVRQHLYGQRFFEANFGVRAEAGWLPDTFGFSAQIPQITRLAGMRWFMNNRPGLNKLNEFPHSTYNWVAPDGTQVICHMPPAGRYDAPVDLDHINRTITRNRTNEIVNKGMLIYGWGDGGGGPTSEQLEFLRRARGFSDTVGQLPPVHLGATVADFFRAVEAQSDNGKLLPAFVGELYLEYFRGCLTSQSEIKKGNRHSEVFLHDIEMVATNLSLLSESFHYPKKELDRLWHDVLVNQFHDILPGTCIQIAMDEAIELYQTILKNAAHLFQSILAQHHGRDATAVVNTLPWARQEVVEVSGSLASNGGVYQSSSSGDSYLVPVHLDGPGLVRAGSFSPRSQVKLEHLGDNSYVLENSHLRIVIHNGLLTSVVNLTNSHEVIPEGVSGSQFILFDDEPLNGPAWSTEEYSLAKRKNLHVKRLTVLESGPLRASISLDLDISNKSWLKTKISLDADSPYLEYNSEIEWHESCKFLKIEFPVNVNSDTASYDSMYGVTKRPTHYNTGWDLTRFEVACQKFADLSDATCGVAVLNDSKYGFATHGNVMRLSLIRAPKAPDANSDMGHHTVRFALYPHDGPLTGQVVRTAINFNHPLRQVTVPDTSHQLPDLSVIRYEGPSHIIIGSIKRAEDDQETTTGELPTKSKKSVVVRLYDSIGGQSTGSITSKVPIKKAFVCNVLEDDLEEVPVRNQSGLSVVDVKMRSFEIKSYRLVIA